MSHSALITSQKKQERPILIVDRYGLIGEALAKQLKSEALIVLVSKKQPLDKEDIIHIPFVKKFPAVPDNTYSDIFLIDEDLEIAKDVLEAFIKKANKDDSGLILIVGYKVITGKFIDNFISQYSKAKIAILGDIFAKDYIFNSKNEINKFIAQVKNSGKIIISGDGTKETMPVFLDDAISGILQTIFGTNQKDKIFYIFPKYPITLLSLSHMFLRKNPNLHVDFVKDVNLAPKIFVPSEKGIYILGEEYNLEDKIKQIDFENINVADVEEKISVKEREEKQTGFSWWGIIAAFIFFLLLPLIVTLSTAFIGMNSLYSTKTSFESANLEGANATAAMARSSFDIALNSAGVLLEEAKLIGQGKKVEEFMGQLKFARTISQTSLSLTGALVKIKAVSSGKSDNPAVDFSSSLTEIKNALLLYDQGKQANLVPKDMENKIEDLVSFISPSINLWSDMLGFKNQKTYLVLFQNNNELRPGGGFIGSYGLLMVNKGKLVSFKIHDVYDADGQLREHFEPPFAIRRHLPIKNWFMRDSNFNVDFSKSAVASAVFLNAETRDSVDGVIGVDLTFVKNLLSAVGPVEVTDYKETVTADNFFQITESHVQNEFFPGSTQKKDFLRSLYNSLQLKLADGKSISYLRLLTTIANSIYEKHLLFVFNNLDQEAMLMANGWSSTLTDQREIKDGKLNDFMGVSEANLGANKVNYYIARSMSQKVSIQDDGSILEDLTIAFKNNSQKNSFGGGTYKNYQRIILPLGAILTKIQIDGKVQVIVPAVTDPSVYEKKGFVSPSGIEVEKQDQNQNTIYGFLINLQPQDLRTIRIEYKLAQKFDLTKPNPSYSLWIFKQPGIDSYPYDFSLSLSKTLKIINLPSDMQVGSGKALLSTQISRDRIINFGFGIR